MRISDWSSDVCSSDLIAGLVRAATNICEAFIGQWLVVRAGEEVAPLPAECIALRARPVVAVDGVVLVSQDGTESPLDEAAYRVTISRDGSACITVPDPGDAARVRVEIGRASCRERGGQYV